MVAQTGDRAGSQQGGGASSLERSGPETQQHPNVQLHFTPTYSAWLNQSRSGSPRSNARSSPSAFSPRSGIAIGQLWISRSHRRLCFSTGLTIVSRWASELLWGMELKSVGRYSAVGSALQLDAIYIKHRDKDPNDVLPDVEACVPNAVQERRLCQRRIQATPCRPQKRTLSHSTGTKSFMSFSSPQYA